MTWEYKVINSHGINFMEVTVQLCEIYQWLMEDCSNSIAYALELPQSYTKPSISCCCIVEYCACIWRSGARSLNEIQRLLHDQDIVEPV